MGPFELKSARYLAADHLARVIREGDTVADATAGNGHDTCFLAELAGAAGRVYAFDIQASAIESTAERLAESGLSSRVTLLNTGHEHMAEHIREPLRAVMFNLGSLPGGNKQITTQWETTRRALEQALSLLMPLGVCTVCVYPGHASGEEERQRLTEYLAFLRPQEYNVLHEKFLNAGAFAPECFVIQRME